MLEPVRRIGRSNEDDSFIGFRVGVLLAVGLVLFGVIGFRLWYLQILSGDQFVQNSVTNRERTVIIEAPRGGIYDRNGVPLVQNRAGLSVGFLAMDMPDPDSDEFYQEIYRLSEILNLPAAQLLADYDKAASEPHKTYVVKEDVEENSVVAYLEEHKELYPGVEVEKTFLREYAYPYGAVTAHALGYVGEISDDDLSQPEFAELKGGTHVGKDGVERQYDSYLRGKDGWRVVEVDAGGKPVNVLDENPADTGYNLYLTIDAKLQAAAEAALLKDGIQRARLDVSGLGFTNAAAGAVVAMDPRNGEILAIASYPDYDPEKWVGGISTADFAAYNAETSYRPLYNRAMNGLYPAGSTFKPFVASSAMQAGLLTWDEMHDCGGRFRLPIGTGASQTFQIWKCWVSPNAHHELNLRQAIQQSCDFYFYNVGYKTYQQPTPVLQDGLRKFGFGRSTGIDLPGETEQSVVPDKVWAREHGTEWKTGDEINLAIGQGYLQTTPLQEAVALAALVNGGTVWVPHIGMQITDSSNRVISTMQSEKRGELGIDQSHLEVVKEGMKMVVGPGGTAEDQWKNFSVDVGGKTGTSQVIGLNLDGSLVDDYALFIGYGPANATSEPSIVVVCVVEQGGHGSSVASPVVRRVMEAYFGLPKGWIPNTTDQIE